MFERIGLSSLIGLLAVVGPAPAQTYYDQGSPQQQRPAPGAPQSPPPYPTQHQRPNPAEAPQQPPFTLTPLEQAQLDRVLEAWEQYSSGVKTFEAKFTRWHYDGVFGDPEKPVTDEGEVKYAAPDKGVFQVFGERPEHWVCDGNSIYEYNFQKKQLIEYRLPPELQGKAISDGPLPFLFGTTAAKLKERYFLRIITPEENRDKGQAWLEAQPRSRQDAENFRKAEVILDAGTMQPVAIRTHHPNGKTRTAYELRDVRINAKDFLRGLDPLRILTQDPFRPHLPRGWTKIVEEPVATQASRPPTAGTRR